MVTKRALSARRAINSVSLIVVLLVLPSFFLHAQTFSGYVKDAHSGERLPGVSIKSVDGKLLGFADQNGYFSVASADASLSFSMVGYLSTDTLLTIGPHLNTVLLRFANHRLSEVDVKATGRDDFYQGVIKLSASEIISYPSIMGEKDLIKVVQTLPGVKRVVEGASGFSVRGGGPDQNLVLLDGVPLYSYNHLFGLFSMFNTDAVKSVDLSRDGISAAYGGRASSVLNITLKDGDLTRWHGNVGIGLLSSKLTFNGPIIKNKLTAVVSLRRSYLDLLARPFMSKTNTMRYHLLDVAGKINYHLSATSRLTAGYYGSEDMYRENNSYTSLNNGTYDYPVDLGWRNQLGYIKYSYASDGFSLNATAYSTHYNFFNDETSFHIREGQKTMLSKLGYKAAIRDLGVDLKAQKVLPRGVLLFGGGILSRRLQPQRIIEETASQTTPNEITSKATTNQEAFLFAESENRPIKNLMVTAGLRAVMWNDELAKGYVEPRFSATYTLPFMAVKSAYFRMNQFVHLLSATGGALPNDVWIGANDYVRPVSSDQFSLSAMKSFDFRSQSVHLEISAYHKLMKGVTEYANGQTIFSMLDITSDDETLSDVVESGSGKSRGVELLVRYKSAKLSTTLSYTLSRTAYRFPGINEGEPYYPGFDRLHDLNITTFYPVRPKIDLSVALVIGSASPVTLPAGIYNGMNISGSDKSRITTSPLGLVNYRNNYRIEPYYRFDVGLSFRKRKKRVERSWEISLFNAMARKNPFYYNIKRETIDFSRRLVKYSAEKKHFITIVPSVSYVLTF